MFFSIVKSCHKARIRQQKEEKNRECGEDAIVFNTDSNRLAIEFNTQKRISDMLFQVRPYGAEYRGKVSASSERAVADEV